MIVEIGEMGSGARVGFEAVLGADIYNFSVVTHGRKILLV